MAPSPKRARTSEDVPPVIKDCYEPSSLPKFMKWCEVSGFNVNPKVTVTSIGSSCYLGMLARENIDKDEILFEVPRQCLLKPETSAVAELLSSSKEIKGRSGWAALILALMYESSNPNSFWRHYLDVCPNFTDVELPLFWTRDLLSSELKCTGVDESVEQDSRRIEEEFSNIVEPFVKKHSDIFKSELCTLDYYKKLAAFVMAYSFTEPMSSEDKDGSDSSSEDLSSGEHDEPSGPMMVPLADILNHVSLHNAQLSFGKKSLVMVAIRNIKQGEEVYNTYGCLSSAELLHMYGFCELPGLNKDDVVELSGKAIWNAYRQRSSQCSLDERWKDVERSGKENVTFAYGTDGFLDPDDLTSFLKLMYMTDDEYTRFIANTGWESDDEEEEEEEELEQDIHLQQALTNNDCMRNLQRSWKDVFLRVANEHVQSLASSADNDSEVVATLGGQSCPLAERKKLYCASLRQGHRLLLSTLANICRAGDGSSPASGDAK